MAGLRERKVAATRARISDTATRLFERRGFDAVTLAEVADAAEVSIRTVTNHFGAKEDLFFDAEPAILDALCSAVAGSAGSATAAVRPMVLDGPILAGPCPWHAIAPEMWEAMRVWAACERSSTTLTARRSAILHGWLEPLASASGSPAWAAMLVGALLLRHDVVQEGLVRRDPPHAVHERLREGVGTALDALEAAGLTGTNATHANPGEPGVAREP